MTSATWQPPSAEEVVAWLEAKYVTKDLANFTCALTQSSLRDRDQEFEATGIQESLLELPGHHSLEFFQSLLELETVK